MDYKYLDQTEGSQKNYYQANSYQQPAAQSTAYPPQTAQDPNMGYGGDQTQNYNDDYQYQDPGATDQYQEGNYGTENAEPSLSDYNSHESCVRITTKK